MSYLVHAYYCRTTRHIAIYVIAKYHIARNDCPHKGRTRSAQGPSVIAQELCGPAHKAFNSDLTCAKNEFCGGPWGPVLGPSTRARARAPGGGLRPPGSKSASVNWCRLSHH